MRQRVTVDQVKQREQEQPHDIDEVPVQPEIFDWRDVSRAEVASLRLAISQNSSAMPMIMCSACMPVIAK